jgi:hypothetical protein
LFTIIHLLVFAKRQFRGSKVQRFRGQGSGFRVQGSRFRVQGSRFRVQGSKVQRFKVQGSTFKVRDKDRMDDPKTCRSRLSSLK